MKYISDIFMCLFILKTVLSRNDSCKQIESVAGDNLMEKFRTDYLIQSDVRLENVNDYKYYKQKQLFQIVEKFPLNINGLGEIQDYKIQIDWEKQIYRFSLLNVNQQCVSISQSQKFNIYSTDNTIIEQPKLQTFTTYLINNASQCKQFDENKHLNYYVYCFYDNSLNIYTINQNNQVELYFEQNLTKLSIESKKKIIFMKDLNIILFITYNKDQCEIFQIDNQKQALLILEINKFTYSYEEILMINLYQNRFLQIYFDNDTLMFDILMSKFQTHMINFYSKTNQLEGVFTVKLSKNQQEKCLIDNINRILTLSCEHEIPQFLIHQSKLILIYSNNVEIIEFGLIRQNIDISIKQIYSLSSNYLIGIDSSDNIFSVKLNLISRNYRTSSLNETELILQHYRISKFNFIHYFGCYYVNIITQEQKDNQRKQKNRDFLEQNHLVKINALNKFIILDNQMIFSQQEFYLQTTQTQQFQITNLKSQNDLIKKYINMSQYFFYGTYDTYIQCQDNKLIIIYYEIMNQVERFNLSCDSSEGKIYNFKQTNQFCVVTKDNYGINIFSFKSITTANYKVEYKGLKNLTHKITKISPTGQYLVAYHNNCSISLFDKQLKFFITNSFFVGKYTDICSIESFIIIDDEKSIVFYQEDKIAIRNYLNDSIIKIQIQNFVCFASTIQLDKTIYICVHKFQQILYTYELEQDELIMISEIKIINYIILRPINFQIDSNSIVILSTQKDQLFLLYFIIQGNLMLELTRIIKIFNLNYNLDNNFLSFPTEQHKLHYLPFQYYQFYINEQITDQSRMKTLTFLIDFVENFTQIFHNFTLELEINLIMQYPELIENYPKKLVQTIEKQFNLKVDDFVNGPIENMQLLNQQNAILIQPHTILQKYRNCYQYICSYNDDYTFLIIYDEFKQSSFNTSLQIEACQILIAYLNKENILIFLKEKDGLLELYFDNQKKKQFMMDEIVQNVILKDELLLIKSQSQKAIIRYYNDQFIIEKYECNDLDFSLIREYEENHYIIVMKKNDSTLILNSTTIRNRNQVIVSSILYKLHNNVNENCLRDILSIQNINILRVFYNQTEQTYQIKVIFFSKYFCHICIIKFSNQNFIQIEQTGIFQYPFGEQFSFIVYQDINYLLVQFINGSWLYQISDNQRQNYYPVFQFNSTNANFQQKSFNSCTLLKEAQINLFNYYKLIGEYQLQFLEYNHNITLEFLAQYKEHKIYFNVTLDHIETQNRNIQFNFVFILIILTFICILLIYCYCQNKRQNENLNHKKSELELEQVEISSHLEQESRLNQQQ